MRDPPVTLSQVEEIWIRKRVGLVFPPAIEALYQIRMLSYRRSFMISRTLPLIVVYNLFLIVDVMLAPQTLALSAFLHLAIVTPAVALMDLIYARARSVRIRDLAAVAPPVLIVAQIMFIYWLNHTEASDHYQYLAVMVAIYANINRRVGLRLAVAATTVIAFTYLAVLLPGHSDFDTKFIGSTMMLTSAYLTLIAAGVLEREARFSFLSRLREQLMREDAEKRSRADPLTGLANRRSLDDAVEGIWRSDLPASAGVAIVMIDIDRFKQFNDFHGHLAGDDCLRRVAGAILSELRGDQDIAARYGGEEFILVLPQTGLQDAVRLAGRLRRKIVSLAIPNRGSPDCGFVTASFGVASGMIGSTGFGELISAADAALYAAKQAGRNRVCPGLDEEDPAPPLFDEGASEASELKPEMLRR